FGPNQAEAAAFGRRPRLAAARPGILPAQLSQRSAALAPRRASVYVTRMAAPLPSSTSFPQLSQTRTVFRAKRSSSFSLEGAINLMGGSSHWQTRAYDGGF